MSRPSSSTSLPTYASILTNRRGSPGVANFIGSRNRSSFKNNTSRQPPTSPPPPPASPKPTAETALAEEFYEAESDSRSNTPRPARGPDFQQIFDSAEYNVFDEEDTLSLDGSTIKYEEPAQTPLVGDSSAPWRGEGRPRSNSGKSGKERVVNTEARLWGDANGEEEYYDDGGDGEPGFDDAGEYIERGVASGRRFEEEDEDAIWESGSPTISSKGWLDQRSHEKEWKETVLPCRNGRPESRESALVKGEDDHSHSHKSRRREAAAERQGKMVDQNQRSTEDRSINFTPLISDSELAKIPSYQDLLSTLSSLRSTSHALIPQTQLPTEISELGKSYYPHDTSKPSKFFRKLDDKQHAAAGDFIVGKKRELESQLVECVNKRRAVVEGMKDEVEKVADVRVKKLKRTEEHREVLKGGIGKILRESGLVL